MKTLTEAFELTGTYDPSEALDFVGPEGFVHGWIYVGGPGLPKDHPFTKGDRFIGNHPTMGTVEGRITHVRSGGNITGKVTSGEHQGEIARIHRSQITHAAKASEVSVPETKTLPAVKPQIRSAVGKRQSEMSLGDQRTSTFRPGQRIRAYHPVYGNIEATVTRAPEGRSVVATVHTSNGDVPGVRINHSEIARSSSRRPSAGGLRTGSVPESPLVSQLKSLSSSWQSFGDYANARKTASGRIQVKIGAFYRTYPNVLTAAQAIRTGAHTEQGRAV